MYVAFVDLLGFSSAVEGLSDAEADSFANLVSQTTTLDSDPPWSHHLVDGSVREFYDMYTNFQRKCEKAAWRLSRFCSYTQFAKEFCTASKIPDVEMPKVASYRTIVFSDSIFLACTALEPVLHAAGELIAHLLRSGIPSRGAIAMGNFHNFEWNLHAGQAESFRASAPFLGSGVIRAFQTESKGPRGIRLLIHNSCLEDVRMLDSWALADLASEEVSEHWSHEVNLGLYTNYDRSGKGSYDSASIEFLICKTEYLSSMVSEDIKTRHYDPTIRALSRMAEVCEGRGERQKSSTGYWLHDDSRFQ